MVNSGIHHTAFAYLLNNKLIVLFGRNILCDVDKDEIVLVLILTLIKHHMAEVTRPKQILFIISIIEMVCSQEKSNAVH